MTNLHAHGDVGFEGCMWVVAGARQVVALCQLPLNLCFVMC